MEVAAINMVIGLSRLFLTSGEVTENCIEFYSKLQKTRYKMQTLMVLGTLLLVLGKLSSYTPYGIRHTELKNHRILIPITQLTFKIDARFNGDDHIFF